MSEELKKEIAILYCGYAKRGSKYYISCEVGCIHCKDKIMKRDFVKQFCTSKEGSENCPIKRLLDDYYYLRLHKPPEPEKRPGTLEHEFSED